MNARVLWLECCMAISRKFQHGDVVVFHDESPEIAKVIRSAPLIGKIKQKAYYIAHRAAVGDNYADYVICDFGTEIKYMEEDRLELATDAERILYGKRKI